MTAIPCRGCAPHHTALVTSRGQWRLSLYSPEPAAYSSLDGAIPPPSPVACREDRSKQRPHCHRWWLWHVTRAIEKLKGQMFAAFLPSGTYFVQCKRPGGALRQVGAAPENMRRITRRANRALSQLKPILTRRKSEVSDTYIELKNGHAGCTTPFVPRVQETDGRIKSRGYNDSRQSVVIRMKCPANRTVELAEIL